MRRDLMCGDYLKKIESNFLNLKITRNILFTTFSMFVGFILWLLGRYIIDSEIFAPAPNIIVVTSQIDNFWEFFPKYWPPQILNLLSSFKWVYFFPLFLITKLLKKSSNSFMKIYVFNFKGYFGIHFNISFL